MHGCVLPSPDVWGAWLDGGAGVLGGVRVLQAGVVVRGVEDWDLGRARVHGVAVVHGWAWEVGGWPGTQLLWWLRNHEAGRDGGPRSVLRVRVRVWVRVRRMPRRRGVAMERRGGVGASNGRARACGCHSLAVANAKRWCAGHP